MERRHIPRSSVEIRQDGEEKFIQGMGAVFYRSDDPGTQFELAPGLVERISPTAFDRAIAENDDTRALYNHNPDNLLGKRSVGTLELSKTKRGLQYRIKLDDADPDHQRVVAKIQRGDLNGSSFGFHVESESFTKDGDLEIREINSVRLMDVGPVTFPAYNATSAGLRDNGDYRDGLEAYERYKKKQAEEELQRYRDRATVAEVG